MLLGLNNTKQLDGNQLCHNNSKPTPTYDEIELWIEAKTTFIHAYLNSFKFIEKRF